MKARNIEHCNTSPTPKEWRQIPEIKAACPKVKNREIYLSRLDGLPKSVILVQWHTGYGGAWTPNGPIFRITKR
jgi:hypothetical protein